MDYAFKEEIADLFAAGADIVQLESMAVGKTRTRRGYGVESINRALSGAAGTTAVHIRLGYAAMTRKRPDGYSFLPQVKAYRCDQIRIRTAQVNLGTSVLQELRGKTIVTGLLDLSDMTVETPDNFAARIRRALHCVDAGNVVVAPNRGLKYLPRGVAFGKMKAMADGAAIARAEHA